MTGSFFAERRQVMEYRMNRRGELSASRQELSGLSRSLHSDGDWSHQASSGSEAVALAAGLAGAAAAPATAVLVDAPPPRLRRRDAARLAAGLQVRAMQGGAAWCEVLLQHGTQRVACGGPEEQRTGVRQWLIVELRAGRPDGDLVWRACSYPDLITALEHPQRAEARLEELLSSLHAGPRVGCPAGRLPVVLAPGSATGPFFHEVCGHPLEGDVLVRRSSYLARRLGQTIAGAQVSVADDPTGDAEAVEFAFDDQGTPSRPVWLIHQGRVEEPLLDLRTAQLLGRSSNGHGRRVSYLHPPLPRMSHTRFATGADDPSTLLAGIPLGLYVHFLRPRHMNLLSGDFSFFIVEARLIEHGQLGPRILPGVLRGNGVEALQRLEAVGSDSRSHLSTRGCRKLDHGPLRVSFGQPSLRFEALEIEPEQ